MTPDPASGVPSCGTLRACRRHKKLGEHCDECSAFMTDYERERFRLNPERRARRAKRRRLARRQGQSEPEPASPSVPVLDGLIPCRADPDQWFSDKPAEIAAAKKSCRACPVLAECGEWVLAHPQPHGVWAGLSGRDRRRIERQQRRRTSGGAA